jgi:hypothetical protein
MDLDLIMDSFANSIFNGTSIFGGVGTSTVNGIRVSGINLDNSKDRLSVTLSGELADIVERNNSSGITNETKAMTNSTASSSVTVIALRIPINLDQIISLAASSSPDMGSNMTRGDMGFNQGNVFDLNGLNPFSILTDLQLGSSSVTNVDWSVPKTITMDLVGGGNNNNNTRELKQTYSNNTSTADLVLVSVIPYTGSKT